MHALRATLPPAPQQKRGGPNEPDFIGLLLTVIRLEQVKTDLVVSVNVPYVPGQYDEGHVNVEEGKLGPLMERAVEMRDKVAESLEIKDWGLFGED